MARSDSAGQHAFLQTASGRDVVRFWALFERVVLVFTLLSLGLGGIAFTIDYDDRKQARKVNAATLLEIEDSRYTRVKEEEARAWSLLTTPATGNSGKREALQFLASQGVSLRGIDLSCEKMGGGWSADERRCANPVFLQELRLTPPEGRNVDLRGARFQGADLTGADFGGAELDGAYFTGALLTAAGFEEAQVRRADFSGALLRGVRFNGAYLSSSHFVDANLAFAEFPKANLSGARLDGAQVTRTIFSGVLRGPSWKSQKGLWAWEPNPPIGMPSVARLQSCPVRTNSDAHLRPPHCPRED